MNHIFIKKFIRKKKNISVISAYLVGKYKLHVYFIKKI